MSKTPFLYPDEDAERGEVRAYTHGREFASSNAGMFQLLCDACARKIVTRQALITYSRAPIQAAFIQGALDGYQALQEAQIE